MRKVSNKAYLKQLKLAVANDRNIAQARKGLKTTLPVQRRDDEPSLDPLTNRAQAYNHLLSVLGPARAEAFLRGQTDSDIMKINIYWNDLKPVLGNKIGLTKTFFDRIINKI
jgi:hypothetical protein